MSRFRYQDVIIELIDLSKTYIDEINQQMNYFRASVYKSDLDIQVKENIERLRTLAKLIPDLSLAEAIMDFDSEVAHEFNSQSSETLFSDRVDRLVSKFSKRFELIELNGLNFILSNNSKLKDYERTLRHKKEDLLSVARQNTKQWNMFNNI